MHQFYIKFAKIQKRRMRKLPEERTVVDYDLTEKTLLDKFEIVFGKGSKVLGQLIYIYGSQMVEHTHFDFVKFINIFIDLYSENKEDRNKVIFKLLDLENTNKLNIITLL